MHPDGDSDSKSSTTGWVVQISSDMIFSNGIYRKIFQNENFTQQIALFQNLIC